MAHIVTEFDPITRAGYNSRDVCVTREVRDALAPRLDDDTRRIYQFEHRCQMAAIAMTLRGVLIDPQRRAEAITFHEEAETSAAIKVNQQIKGVWDVCGPRPPGDQCANHPGGGNLRRHNWVPRGGQPTEQHCKYCGGARFVTSVLNLNSSQQTCHLFYDLLNVRARHDRVSGHRTVDSEALESIEGEAHRVENEGVALLAKLISDAKKHRKQIGYAKSRLSADGRMRSAINVGATETGRWSASKAPDWSGWNVQQISEQLRGMIVADQGLEIFYADLEQAESHIVAYDSGDQAYIAAHLTGDVHTQVCRMIYKDIKWTGDLASDKALAETYFPWDPFHTKRDHMKRVQHGGNMGRSPQGIARQLHIPVAKAKEFFNAMYGARGAFPAIKARHAQVHAELQRTGITVSCLGRKRQFLGRVWDDETLREALGQLEQSPVADILNLAIVRIWEEMDLRVNVWDPPHPRQPNRVWLLAQVHDAILGLYRPGDLETLRRVKELMEIPLEINGYICKIPVEIKVGPSWSKTEMRKVKL